MKHKSHRIFIYMWKANKWLNWKNTGYCYFYINDSHWLEGTLVTYHNWGDIESNSIYMVNNMKWYLKILCHIKQHNSYNPEKHVTSKTFKEKNTRCHNQEWKETNNK